MNLAEPTMVTIQVDSAWLVVLAVSLATLPVVMLLRRTIARFGGSTPGLLLLIPLLLPLVAAVIFQHGVLPEISVLKPAASALLDGSDHVRHLLLLDGGKVVIPYALTSSAGPWLILIGGSLIAFMLVRRLVGHLAVRRVVARASRLAPEDETSIMAAGLATSAGLREAPEVFVSLHKGLGAFATGGRKPSIVLSEDLFEHLDEGELRAVLAHEIAHIAARDVGAITLGGLLRDMVAWNPLAHLAYRYMRRTREVEADRRAAALTEDPLAVASGLVKMCKLVGRGSGRRRLAALAFAKRKEPISVRVSGLLALADGRARVRQIHWSPYLLAMTLVVALGLHVGAQLARANGSALAFVWGRPDTSTTLTWAGDPDVWEPKNARAESGEQARGERKAERKRVKPANLQALIRRPMAVREKDFSRWLQAVAQAAKERGLPARPILQQSNWGSEALIGGETTGSFGTYWIRREPSH